MTDKVTKPWETNSVRALPVVAFLAAVALVSPAADACTCTAPPLAQALAQSESAFVGTVASTALDADTEKRVVTFLVKRVFKGVVPEQVPVVTPLTEIACGFTFPPGGTYLVFTRNIRGKPLTHVCSGNVPSTPKGPWPKELDAGWSPVAAGQSK